MVYVHRNPQGDITALTRWPSGSTEALPDNDPDVVAFRNPPPRPPRLEAQAQALEAAGDLASVKSILANVLRNL